MATAVLLLASGISFIGATAANATTPVVASTSIITVGQANPTLEITSSSSTFASTPSITNFTIGWTGSSTGLTRSAVSLSGNTITLSLSGTTLNGTLTLTISAAAFTPSASGANVLNFQAQPTPATVGAMTLFGGSAPTANSTSPNGVGGSMGQWTTNSLFTWSPALTNSRFAAGTVYTGTIDVVPTNGYNFEGLSSSFFTLSGATSVSATYTGSNPRTSATITIVFPATAGGSSSGAICSADSLSSSSTIKGVTFNKGTRQANSTDFNGNGSSFMGSITLTSAEASGTGITSIAAGGGATVTWLYVSPSINSWSNSDINTTANLQGITLLNGRLFEIKVSGTGCSDYYRIRITVPSSGSGSAPSTSSGAAILGSATIAQQRQMFAAISASKSSLSEAFGTGKASTLAAFSSAGLTVSSEAALARINSKILLLPIEKRSKIEEIEKIVEVENFVDRISNNETRPSITPGQLVSKGYIALDNPLKISITNALLSREAASLDTVEKIKDAIVAETARLQERVKRTAEIKAKIAARRG